MSTDAEIMEAEATLVSVTERIGVVYGEIGTAAAGGLDISGLTLEYGSLIAQKATLTVTVNARLIEDEKSAVFGAISELLGTSRLSELLGEPVTTLTWSVTPGSGDNGPVLELKVNPTIVTAGKGRSGARSTGGKGSGRVKYTDGTEEYTAREMVLKFASQKTLDLSLVAHGEGKWVTKPEHVTDALANAEVMGINLTQVIAVPA